MSMLSDIQTSLAGIDAAVASVSSRIDVLVAGSGGVDVGGLTAAEAKTVLADLEAKRVRLEALAVPTPPVA